MSGPAIILVVPQLGENIGAVARAMHNFALSDLRLVRPRDGWPNPAAVPMAAGAGHILDDAQVFGSTEAAIADLDTVYATTARERGMIKPVLDARAAGEAISREAKSGILFGGEKAGLANEDVVLADTIINIPVNPAFGSINIAQAVLLVAYEVYQAGGGQAFTAPDEGVARKATKDELQGLFDHLEGELHARNFFFPETKKPGMIRNLRNLWQRADLRHQDVQTLRGIIKNLATRDPVEKGGK